MTDEKTRGNDDDDSSATNGTNEHHEEGEKQPAAVAATGGGEEKTTVEPEVKKYRGIPEDVKLFEVFWHQVVELIKVSEREGYGAARSDP